MRNSQQPSIAEQAKELIEGEYPFLEGIEDLADRLAVSKCHLVRSFTKAEGVSPGQYLTAVRIGHAKALLITGQYSVELVAQMVGYFTGNYFCKVFKKWVGITPGEYGRENKKASPIVAEEAAPDARYYV